MQYEPDAAQDDYFKEKVEQLQYDNEALKLLVADLKAQLDEQNGKWASARPSPAKSDGKQFLVDRISPSTPKMAHDMKNLSLNDYDPLESLGYFEKRDTLNAQLNALTQEKQRLSFEHSRVPLNGSGKHRKRMNELEFLLDDIDVKIAQTRKRMRDLGVL